MNENEKYRDINILEYINNWALILTKTKIFIIPSYMLLRLQSIQCESQDHTCTAAPWRAATHRIARLKINGGGEGGVMDFIGSHGGIDQHQPGQDDNYMLIVLHPHFAFPFNQM